MIRAALTLAGLAAVLILAAEWQTAARDARETIHDGQTPAALCGDICREPAHWDEFDGIVDPAEACEPGEPAILGDDC